MCRRNSGQSRRKRRICSRILVCSPALRSTTIEEGTVIPPTTRDKLALSGVADRNCRCHSLLQCVRPITWFDLERPHRSCAREAIYSMTFVEDRTSWWFQGNLLYS